MKLLIVLALFGCAFALPQQQVAEVFPVYEEDVVLEPEYEERIPEFAGETPNLADDEMPIEDPAAEMIPVDDGVDPDYIPRTHVIIRPFSFKPFRPFYRPPSPFFTWRRESPYSPVDEAEPETERRPSLWDILFRDFNGPPFLNSRPRQPEEEAPVEDSPSEGGHRYGFHNFFNSFFNQPQLPDLPRVDHSDYPSNFSNSTYDVHEVNGNKFAVNTTIRKHSGPGFNNFFHFRVVHHLPGEETPEEVPQEYPEEEIPQEYPEEIPQEYPEEEVPQEYPEEEVPQEYPEEQPESIPEEVPVVEENQPPVELPVEAESTNSDVPIVPEIYNELDNEIPSEVRGDI